MTEKVLILITYWFIVWMFHNQKFWKELIYLNSIKMISWDLLSLYYKSPMGQSKVQPHQLKLCSLEGCCSMSCLQCYIISFLWWLMRNLYNIRTLVNNVFDFTLWTLTHTKDYFSLSLLTSTKLRALKSKTCSLSNTYFFYFPRI